MRAFPTLLLAALLAACSTTKDTAAPPSELTDFERGARIDEPWSADTGGGTDKWIALQPFVAGDRLVAANVGGRVSAYTLADGDRQWAADIDQRLSAGVGGTDATVAVGTGEGTVVALAVEDGSERWRTDLNGELLAPPAGGDGRLVVRTVDGRVVALDEHDGEIAWSYSTDVPSLSLRGNGRPLLVSGGVLTGLDNGRLIALSSSNGQPLWQSTIAEPTGASAVERMVDIDGAIGIGRQVAYAVTYQGRIAQVEPRNGNVAWARDMSSYAGLSADGNRVYVSTADSHVVALDPASGDTLWRQDALAHRQLTAPVPVPGTDFLAVGDLEGYVHILTRADGRLVNRRRIGGDSILGDPVPVGEGRIAVQDRDDDLAVLEVGPLEDD